MSLPFVIATESSQSLPTTGFANKMKYLSAAAPTGTLVRLGDAELEVFAAVVVAGFFAVVAALVGAFVEVFGAAVVGVFFFTTAATGNTLSGPADARLELMSKPSGSRATAAKDFFICVVLACGGEAKP